MKENKNKQHKHFKFSEDKLSDNFDDHKKVAVWVGVFLILILCAVILIFIDWQEQKQNLNASQEELNKNQNVLAIKENYEKEAKKIIEDYTALRDTQEMLVEHTCLVKVDYTLEKVFALVVPTEYKDFHLALVILLDKEKQACADYTQEKDELDGEWEEFINSMNF